MSRFSHAIDQFLQELSPPLATDDVHLANALLTSAFGLVSDHPDELDLKITSSAVAEMREAFTRFAPFRSVPKVTIFGSARTTVDDPMYAQAEDVARLLAAQGWMVVTGAGPGIMTAAAAGAGLTHSLGVNIRLPFEQKPNAFIADANLVSMKYFFTRKLMLMKESKAFVCLPGGFGTLDETFELLTLTQTGKGIPAPIVFLDTPGEAFWGPVDALIKDVLLARGLITADDLALYRMTDDAQTAVNEINDFYRNFHSIRFYNDQLVLRVQRAPSVEQMASLNAQFRDIATAGSLTLIDAVAPTSDDVGEHLRGVGLLFDKRHWGRVRSLINALNQL